MEKNDEASLRQKMVEEQVKKRGIQDELVIESLLTVPRHLFVPSYLQSYAYDDTPLPIEDGQTISQPFIVALMAQLAHLNKQSRVLEIGTGSGYSAAILSRIVIDVYTVERLESLAKEASDRFKHLNYDNIHVKIGDGTLGWPEKGPFDAILVTAGAPVVPEALLNQLNVHGRLIIPVGSNWIQELRCYTKLADLSYKQESIEWVRFVPLIGEQGWKDSSGFPIAK